MWKQFVQLIVRFRVLTIVSIGAVTLLFAYQIWNPWMAGRCLASLFKDETACWWSWKLKMVVDPKTILPQDHPYVQLNDRIEKTFGGSRVVVIGIEPKNGDIFNPRILSGIKEVNEAVKKIPGIKEENVVSIADRKVKYIESTGDLIQVERLMEKMPESEQELEAFKKRVYSNNLYVGGLVSRDGKAASIITDFREWVPAYEESSEFKAPGSEFMVQGSGSEKGTQENPWWKGKQSDSEPETVAKASKENPWWQGSEAEGSRPKAQSSEEWAVSSKDKGEDSSGHSSPITDHSSENPWWSGEEDPNWASGSSGEWPSGGFRMSDTAIYEAVQKASAVMEDNEARVYIGGLPVALAYMEKDSARIVFLFPLALLIMMVILYLAFRSFQGMLLPLLTALLSVVWALGMMGFAGIPMDPFNTLTPILILAVAAGHSIQILKRYYEEIEAGKDNQAAVMEATAKIAPVTVTAALVAAASFGSLITFQLKTFQAFGLFTAFGILSAMILELTFIPALRSILRAPLLNVGARAETQNERSSDAPTPRARAGEAGRSLDPSINAPNVGASYLDRFLSAIANSAPGRRQGVVGALTVLVLILALAGTFQVRVDNSLKSQFFETTRLRTDEMALNQHFAGTSTFYVLVEGDQPNALKPPEVLSKIDQLQRELESVPGVGKTESYVDYVKKMNQTFHGGNPQYDRVPEDQQLVNDFLFLYSISGNPADFARLVDYDYRQAVIWSYLKSDSTALAEDLIQRVESYSREHNSLFTSDQPSAVSPQPTAHNPQLTLGVAGSAPVTVALNRTMVEGKIKNIVQIAAIIFVASALVLRSVLGGILVLLPLSLSVLINFGVMGWTGVTLGIGTAAISAMAVGIGADYAIYLLFRIREEYKRASEHPVGAFRETPLHMAVQKALMSAGKAIIFVALSVSAGYAILPFSGYYLHMEGILVPLAMVTSCLGALVLLPTLVCLLKPRFIVGE